MQNYFQMKARTTKGDWHEFNIHDVPVYISPNEIVLLDVPNSPILDVGVVRRGDRESGMFEGDVIEYDSQRWLVCYERGFYAINEDCVIRYLYTFTQPWSWLGVAGYDVDFPLKYKQRKASLFKHEKVLFYTNQIVTLEDDNIIIRNKRTKIPRSKVRQECCMSYNGRKIFLGDNVNSYPVRLIGGRICIDTKGGIFDLSNGGVLDGYTAKDVR